MASAQGSVFEKFTIISPDGANRVDVFKTPEMRIISFDFFENILSPIITGVAIISSTGGSAESKDDTQNRLGALHTSLPIRAGCTLLVKINSEIGEAIDFSFENDDYKKLYVTDVSVVDSSNSETLAIKFSTRTAWLNETTRISRRFNGKISDSVKRLLKTDLLFKDSEIDIDESSNSYSFLGMRKRPLDLIAMLCIRTVPSSITNPGYFCYETRSGFKFISADKLINQDPFEKTYRFTGQPISTAELKDNSNDYKVSSLNMVKDQSLLSQIRSGVYASKNIFFNPQTNGFTEIDISVAKKGLTEDPKFSSLGKKQSPPELLQKDFDKGKKYHRVQTAIFDVGAEGLDIDVNNSPELYYAAGSTRYNILFSQINTATIPCNTNLEAGSVIKLEVESTSEDKEQGPDQVQSGNYIIQALRHHFEPNKASTSMNLIRDSYGLNFTKSQ